MSGSFCVGLQAHSLLHELDRLQVFFHRLSVCGDQRSASPINPGCAASTSARFCSYASFPRFTR